MPRAGADERRRRAPASSRCSRAPAALRSGDRTGPASASRRRQRAAPRGRAGTRRGTSYACPAQAKLEGLLLLVCAEQLERARIEAVGLAVALAPFGLLGGAHQRGHSVRHRRRARPLATPRGPAGTPARGGGRRSRRSPRPSSPARRPTRRSARAGPRGVPSVAARRPRPGSARAGTTTRARRRRSRRRASGRRPAPAARSGPHRSRRRSARGATRRRTRRRNPPTDACWASRFCSPGSPSSREPIRPCRLVGTGTCSRSSPTPPFDRTPDSTSIRTVSSRKRGLPPTSRAGRRWRAAAGGRARQGARAGAPLRQPRPAAREGYSTWCGDSTNHSGRASCSSGRPVPRTRIGPPARSSMR